MALDIDDVREESARGSDGELIPETKTFEYDGETQEVKVYPVTGGMANKLAEHEQGLEELDPQSVAVVLSTACPDLEDIRKSDVEDMPLPLEIGLVNAVAEQLPDVDVEGNR